MRFDRLDLNLLVALDALLELESVTAAASTLNITQSSMSGALDRLRTYFGDDLLVKNGRQMMPTPVAEQLKGRVRDVLLQIRATITAPTGFEPARSDRCFTIICSDYTVMTLLNALVEQVSHEAPGIRFSFLAPATHTISRFERGEVDLNITVATYLLEGHPQQLLFDDEAVGVCWEGNTAVGDMLDLKTFLASGHVAAAFGEDRHPSFYEKLLADQGISRSIEVSVHSFSLVPVALIGTQRLAVMHRLHAEQFAKLLPLRLLPLPFSLPRAFEVAQWHRLRRSDAGLHWLLGKLATLSRALG